MEEFVWYNYGEWLTFSQIKLDPYDCGVTHGDQVADVERTFNGNLTEGSLFNVFIVTQGVIRTPTDRATLAGISRAMALDLAKQLGIPAYEEDLQPYDLYTADECFFTSTPFSVLPATQVDRRSIGDSRPGLITQQLLAAWSEAVGLDIVDQTLRFTRE
mgnify:CR=1 FL=1